MVLTTGVGNGTDAGVRSGGGHTRRRLLGGTGLALGAGALAGCGLFEDDPAPLPPDPLQPVLDEALTLAAAYDRALAAQPSLAKRLTPLAADHRAHVEELTRVIGRPAPSTAASAAPAGPPPGTDAAETLATLRTAERRAQRTAAAAARQAPAERAALIGSVAACRASHAEALR
jgi:hypothetical protein